MDMIKPLWSEMPLQMSEPPKAAGGGEAVVKNPFTDIFQSAVNAVRETEAEEVEMEYLMATGQLDNPALLSIASYKADLAVDLLVQLRNQAMDAYNELMRISL